MSEEVNTYKIQVTLQDAVDEERIFTTLGFLSEALDKEVSFWKRQIDEIKDINTIVQISNSAQRAFNQLTNYVKNFESWDESNRKQQFISAINKIQQFTRQTIFSSTPAAKALIHACKRGSNQASGFWAYITQANQQVAGIQQPSFLEGAILAYEFFNEDESKILKRRDSEERSLSALRKSLADKTDELVGDADDFKVSLTSWKSSVISEIETQREKDSTELAAIRDQHKKDTDDFFKEAAAKRQELEKIYNELLKLKEPVKCWQDRAKVYGKSGKRWGGVLVLTTLLALVSLMWFFQKWLTADSTFQAFTAHHWQGIVLLAAVLSLFAFLIRTFGKLTFSAFHLQRDSEEREQLAYFYLALLNESEVSEGAKTIVFQSLFSRSETGLLSEEHGPVMPVADLVNSARGGR